MDIHSISIKQHQVQFVSLCHLPDQIIQKHKPLSCIRNAAMLLLECSNMVDNTKQDPLAVGRSLLICQIRKYAGAVKHGAVMHQSPDPAAAVITGKRMTVCIRDLTDRGFSDMGKQISNAQISRQPLIEIPAVCCFDGFLFQYHPVIIKYGKAPSVSMFFTVSVKSTQPCIYTDRLFCAYSKQFTHA